MLSSIAGTVKDASTLRRMLFATAFLPSQTPDFWGIVVEFATLGKTARNTVTPEQTRVLMENLHTLDAKAFSTDQKLLLELTQMPVSSRGNKPLGLVLLSRKDECILCGSKLLVRADKPSTVVVYDNNLGTIPATHFHKYCSKRSCPCTQFYGFYTCTDSGTYYNEDCAELPYFMATRETAIATSLLKQLDAEILVGQLSYKQRAEIYNLLHFSDWPGTPAPRDIEALQSRQVLDRRRLEDAHLKFACHQIATWYPSIHLRDVIITPGLNETLKNLTPLYHAAFSRCYAEHTCSTPGCGSVLVLDGNCKNYRDICKARDAGFIEFEGLEGVVKTGCMNTPLLKSRFCELHAPSVSVRGDMDPGADGEKETGTSERGKEGVASMIMGKRDTRSGTYYQVAWLGESLSRCTWQQASSLPAALIDDFEKGAAVDIVDNTLKSSGQALHTLSVSHRLPGTLTPSPSKQPRLQSTSPVVPSTNTGVFLDEADARAILKCNTEKDKHVRLNQHTAGILAGIWPCGVVTLLSELFIAESKSQVYGALHAFLRANEVALAPLKCICYDDGCHLKRFAENPKRRSRTKTSQQIAELKIVVDKMHFKGHTDAWCKEQCDPYKCAILDNVDTEICEQTFSWLSRYSRMTRHMNKEHFLFYILYICDLHNRRLLHRSVPQS